MSAARIDRSSRRWLVAMHEAAHAIASRELGWSVSKMVINASGGGGYMVPHAPRGSRLFGGHTDDEARHLAIDSAVISLAGPAMNARMSWLFLPAGCQFDKADARQCLRRTGVTYAQAWARADSLVGRRRAPITRLAERLYRAGHLTNPI